MLRRLKIAVFVSGEGTLLEQLAKDAASGQIPVEVDLVVADRSRAPAVEKARSAGLRVLLPGRPEADGERWSQAVDTGLRSAGVELVVLAGFLSRIPPDLVRRWAGRIINVHPALLPRHGGPGMYGPRVHEAVLRAGDTTTGATVHLVTDELDAGPILEQRSIPITASDTPATLRERLRPLEVSALEDVLRAAADGRRPFPFRGASDHAR